MRPDESKFTDVNSKVVFSLYADDRLTVGQLRKILIIIAMSMTVPNEITMHRLETKDNMTNINEAFVLPRVHLYLIGIKMMTLNEINAFQESVKNLRWQIFINQPNKSKVW